MEATPIASSSGGFEAFRSYIGNEDPFDPLLSPVYSATKLKSFPPTLFVNSGRDYSLSAATYSHLQLVKAAPHASTKRWPCDK